MKKALLIFLFAPALNLFSSSANYSLSPGNSVNDVALYNTLSIFDIYMNNTSAAKIKLKWQLVSSNIPSGWDFSLCDYGTCYPGLPASGGMDSVDVASMGFLGLNINPYSIQGTAVVKIFVYENGFFSQGDTLTWTINAVASGIEELNKQFQLVLFPVPAQTEINFKLMQSDSYSDFSYKIFNQSGALADQNMISGKDVKADISSLENGIYYLILYQGDKRKAIAKFLKAN